MVRSPDTPMVQAPITTNGPWKSNKLFRKLMPPIRRKIKPDPAHRPRQLIGHPIIRSTRPQCRIPLSRSWVQICPV